MANTSPVADTAGVVEQVWRLGREAGLVDVQPIGAVTVGLAGEHLAELGAMADSAARVRIFSDDGHCVVRPAADAPGAGVREGVRRRDRPARRGAPADRGRADARGRGRGAARPDRLAGGRRGGDHRPRRAARRARRRPAARLPRLDRRVASRSCARPRRAGYGSPPRSRRTTCCSPTSGPTSYDPVFKVNPPLRTATDVAALRQALADGRDRRGRHRPRPARRGGQGMRVGVRPAGHARPGDGAVDRARRARPAAGT